MLLDYWADYYARHPNASTEEFETDDFERVTAEILAAQDEEWEDVPWPT